MSDIDHCPQNKLKIPPTTTTTITPQPTSQQMILNIDIDIDIIAHLPNATDQQTKPNQTKINK